MRTARSSTSMAGKLIVTRSRSNTRATVNSAREMIARPARSPASANANASANGAVTVAVSWRGAVGAIKTEKGQIATEIRSRTEAAKKNKQIATEIRSRTE